MGELTDGLVLRTDFKITKKIINNLEKISKELKNVEICYCECHNAHILNMHKHNAISVISQFKCIECPCPPIQFNAREFDIFNSKIRWAWKKYNELEWSQFGWPEWLSNDQFFMQILIHNILKENSNAKQ